jgi:polysaccharide export outer membrane protein
VNKPGEYPYVAGMNILKAIAMAGGYSYRANISKVFLTRVNSGEELVVAPVPETIVMPGDFIRIPERFF